MNITKRNNLLLYLFLGCFLVLLTFFLSEEKYLIFSIPFIISIIIIPFFGLRYLFYLIVFLTPLSISLSDLGFFFLDLEMAFPTEPILFGLMILTSFAISYYPDRFKLIFSHRITFFIILYLIWLFVTSITSTMPIVSLKLWLSRCWYIVPVFFIGSLLFQKRNTISYFVMLYSIPLSIVVLYTSIRHAGYGFDKESAHYMMSPFFNDHTSYGAMIAFFLPLCIAFFWIKKNNFLLKFCSLIVIIVLIVGLILSFTRAAWISLFISCVIGLFLYLKVNKTVLFITPVCIFISIFLFQDIIINKLESNRQDSSDNLIEHITSISNISTDASNMERINRWKCALKMFIEKPFFGWGPGTYQFEYARFQLSKDRTIISSNMGDMGNAHSEYLSALSETGIFGFISFFILFLISILHAINMYYARHDAITNTWLLAIIIALLSYSIHGLFNNFLDTDKASIAVWGALAIIVGLDLLKNKKQSHSTVIS